MTATAEVPPGLLERFVKFDANAQWAHLHQKDLQIHQGKYVAIDDQQIVGVAKDPEELRRKFKDRATLYVTFVSPPGLAWLL